MSTAQTTGQVYSGDVTLFYRRFGRAGAVPVLIFHGANYFDSADWIGVGSALAHEREVVAVDQRGFGESTWSPSKDYSNEAHMEDAVRLMDHLGWTRTVFMGHSRGGQHATLLAARFAERTAGLVLVDYVPGSGPPPATGPTVGNPPKVFATLDELQGALSRDRNTPPGSVARARLESIVQRVETGFVLSKRDPDYGNAEPVGPVSVARKAGALDMWRELRAVRAPVLIVRGTQSNRFPWAAIAPLREAFPDVVFVEVEAGHDVAAGAPEALVQHVETFLGSRVG